MSTGRQNAMKSLHIHVIVLLQAILIWNFSGALFAQPTDSMGVSAQPEDIEYIPAVETIKLKNRYSENCYIESLKFHVKQFKVDTKPKLFYQIFPFFDTIIVQISNVGWGTYRGESLSLFNQDESIKLSKDFGETEDSRLVNIFDIDTTSKALSSVVDTSFVVYRVGPKAMPFVFHSMGNFDLHDMYRPEIPIAMGPVGSKKPIVKTVAHTVYKPVPYIRVEGEQLIFGYANFDGILTQFNGSSKKISFLARQIPLVDLATEERLMITQWDHELIGQLNTHWNFIFGNVKYVAEQSVKEILFTSIVGITIDLGVGTESTLNAQVNAKIAPGEILEFPLTFVASKSATFKVDIEGKYRYGESPPRSFLIKQDLTKTIQAPRTTSLEDLGIGKLIAGLRIADPNLEERGKELLKNFSMRSKEEQASLLSNSYELFKIKHALSLALYSEDPGLNNLGRRVIAILVENHSQKKQEITGDEPVYMSLFPLICKFNPDAAVEIAIRDCSDNTTSPADHKLLGQCVCFEKAHPYLGRYREKILQILSDKQQNWDNQEIALAALLKDPKCANLIIERLKGESGEYQSLELFVWASSKLKDPQLDAAIAGLLKSETTNSQAIKVILETAVKCNKEDFKHDVIRLATRIQNKSDYVESLLACIKYLEKYRTADAETLLRGLRDYPLRSEIRDLANKILGE
jgi:hypothetical protein